MLLRYRISKGLITNILKGLKKLKFLAIVTVTRRISSLTLTQTARVRVPGRGGVLTTRERDPLDLLRLNTVRKAFCVFFGWAIIAFYLVRSNWSMTMRQASFFLSLPRTSLCSKSDKSPIHRENYSRAWLPKKTLKIALAGTISQCIRIAMFYIF